MASAAGGLRPLFVVSDRFHGKGKVTFEWNAAGTYLCTSGTNGLVHIFDRQGSQVAEVQLESRAQTLTIDWDKDGESVAILQAGIDRLAIWELATRGVTYIETGLREPTWMKWSRVGPQLAVGSAKGGLCIYRKDTRRKLPPITGKHSKAILCGDWSRDNKLALGGADCLLSVSSEEGDTLELSDLKHAPQAVQFATQKSETRHRDGGAVGGGAARGASASAPAAAAAGAGAGAAETTVSVNMGGKTVLLYALKAGDLPVELAFQARYGRIVKYTWFGDGYLMLGFSEGFCAVISTHMKEIGEELFSARVHPGGVDDLACSVVAQRAAVAGGSSIRMLDLAGWKEVRSECASVDPSHGPIEGLQWTADGAILTASTRSGHVYAFLARLPSLADGCGGRLAFLSSLREVAVVDAADIPGAGGGGGAGGGAGGGGAGGETMGGGGGGGRGDAGGSGGGAAQQLPPLLATVQVATEPGLLALGPRHVCIAMNNRAWFYRYGPSSASGSPPGGGGGGAGAGGSVLVGEKDYSGGSVDAVRLGAFHAAALVDGRVYVHAMEGLGIGGARGAAGGGADPTALTRLPERDGQPRVTCLAIAGDFLFLGSAAGTVDMYSLRDGCALLPGAQLRLDGGVGVRGVWPNAIGTRVVLVDSSGRAFLGNPVEASLMAVPDAPDGIVNALWDVCAAQGGGGSGGGGGVGGGGGGLGGGGSGGGAGARGACFALSTRTAVHSYVYAPVGLTGPTLVPLGILSVAPNGNMQVDPAATPLPPQSSALALLDGAVTAYAPGSSQGGGPCVSVPLITHDALLRRGGRVTPDRVRAAFAQRVALLRLQEAWEDATGLEDTACWLALAGKALEILDLELAGRCYRRLQDAGMVQSLRLIERVEDRRAAAGHVAALFGDTALAQELLLGSSEPGAALDMRRDLLQWDAALALAEVLSPRQVPLIALELARSAEGRGDAAAATAAYRKAQEALEANAKAATSPSTPAERAEDDRVKRGVVAGLARVALRTGDIRRGVSLATESGDRALCRECGGILEGLKMPVEAAGLFRAAEMWDKAASLYISAKAFAQLGTGGLMDMVSTPKLHAAYAKAKEAAKEYGDALRAYEKSRDVGAQVRILVEHLGSPEKAADIVRSTRNAEGAAILAKHCAAVGDTRGAIEFLLLARRQDEAFELAAGAGEMGLYVLALRRAVAGVAVGAGAGADGGAAAAGGVAGGRGGRAALAGGASTTTATSGPVSEEDIARAVLPPAECERAARWFEGKGQHGAAGRLYAEAGMSQRALGSYLSCGEAEIPAAIELAGKARDEAVTAALLDFLLGSSPGSSGPKDPAHVRSLYLALGNFSAAARTALIIARQEQDVGNYKAAHAVLFETVRSLEGVRSRTRVPRDLLEALVVLHSYTLVRRLVRLEDHEGAARMALRCAAAVSRFPAHVVPILTSTVIECARAGLKKSAFENACMLMRPEHRDAVEERYRKKIEALVRRPSEEEADDAPTPCPFCSSPVPSHDLACGTCKSALPFCVLTGRHMTAEDCSACPSCRFPALFSAMSAMFAAAKAPPAAAQAAGEPGAAAAAAAPPAPPEKPSCPMCLQQIEAYAVTRVRDPVPFLRRAAGDAEEEGGGDEEGKRGEDGYPKGGGAGAGGVPAGSPGRK